MALCGMCTRKDVNLMIWSQLSVFVIGNMILASLIKFVRKMTGTTYTDGKIWPYFPRSRVCTHLDRNPRADLQEKNLDCAGVHLLNIQYRYRYSNANAMTSQIYRQCGNKLLSSATTGRRRVELEITGIPTIETVTAVCVLGIMIGYTNAGIFEYRCVGY